MIHMTPFQSWTTLILIFAIVAIALWLQKELSMRRAEHDQAIASAADSAANTNLAVVTELAPTRRRRHLSLVPELPRMPAPKLYDWKIHGL